MALIGRRGIVLLVIVLVVATAVGVWAWRRGPQGTFAEAVAMLPAETLRLSFTDWEQVRGALDATNRTGVDVLVERAYEADLSAVSTLASAGEALPQHFGFSPVTMRWESFAQSRDGAVQLVALHDGPAVDRVAAALRTAGFEEPDEATGRWTGGPDVIGALGPSFTPELQYAVLLREHALVVTSDSPEYVVHAAQVARTGKGSLRDVPRVGDLVRSVDGTLAGMMWTRDFACEDVSDLDESPDIRTRWAQLVEAAGTVTPLSGMVMATQADRTLRIGLAFEQKRQAGANLAARARLAGGEAPGRGAPFPDRFTLTGSSVSGAVVRLVLRPVDGVAHGLSGLKRGPLIFAAC